MMLLSHISEVYMYEYPRVLVRDRGCAKELLKFYQVSFADRKYVLPDAFDQYLQGGVCPDEALRDMASGIL